jgi:Protein of unknown function (DUF3551)
MARRYLAAPTRRIAMRIVASTLFAIGLAAVASRADAQTYAPGYPVCMQVYGRNSHIECSFISLAQCNATASGRAAQCLLNPYYAPPVRVSRYAYHHHRWAD